MDGCALDPKGAVSLGLEKPLEFVKVNSDSLNKWLSYPDVEVLSALVALEKWHLGPKTPFNLGR